MKKKSLIAFLLLLIFGLAGCQAKTDTVSNQTSDENTSSMTETGSETDESTTEDTTSPSVELLMDATKFDLIKGKEGFKTSQITVNVKVNEEEVTGAKITYSSDNDEVVTVDENGTVTALSAGTAGITATYSLNGENYSLTGDFNVYEVITKDQVSTFENNMVNLYGRVYKSGDYATLDNPATAVEVYFYGTTLSVNEKGSSASLYFRVFVDNDNTGTMMSVKSTSFTDLVVAEGLEEGVHRVRIVKCSSPDAGKVLISSFTTDGDFLSAKEKSSLKIEFIGDSITVGFGDLGSSSESQSTSNSDSSKAYAYLTAQLLDADYSIIALEGIATAYRSYAGGINMVDYYEDYSTTNKTEYNPSDFDADIVVVALGENDMWRATGAYKNYNVLDDDGNATSYSVDQFKEDYAAFLKTIHEFHPNAYIICIYGMMPASGTAAAKQAISSAIESSGLENITMIHMSSNTSGSGEHPNAKAHTSYANKLYSYISTNLINQD